MRNPHDRDRGQGMRNWTQFEFRKQSNGQTVFIGFYFISSTFVPSLSCRLVYRYYTLAYLIFLCLFRLYRVVHQHFFCRETMADTNEKHTVKALVAQKKTRNKALSLGKKGCQQI